MKTNDAGNPDPMGLLGADVESTSREENPWYAVKNAEEMFPHVCSHCGLEFESVTELANPDAHKTPPKTYPR